MDNIEKREQIYNLAICGPRKDQNTHPHLSELRSVNYTVTMSI